MKLFELATEELYHILNLKMGIFKQNIESIYNTKDIIDKFNEKYKSI